MVGLGQHICLSQPVGRVPLLCTPQPHDTHTSAQNINRFMFHFTPLLLFFGSSSSLTFLSPHPTLVLFSLPSFSPSPWFLPDTELLVSTRSLCNLSFLLFCPLLLCHFSKTQGHITKPLLRQRHFPLKHRGNTLSLVSPPHQEISEKRSLGCFTLQTSPPYFYYSEGFQVPLSLQRLNLESWYYIESYHLSECNLQNELCKTLPINFSDLSCQCAWSQPSTEA